MSIKKQLKTEYQAKEASIDVDFDSILQQADYPQIEKPEKRPIRFKPVLIAFASAAFALAFASIIIRISLARAYPQSSGGDTTREFDIGTYRLDFVNTADNEFFEAGEDSHLVVSEQSKEMSYETGSVLIGEKYVMTFRFFALSKFTFSSSSISTAGYVVSATSGEDNWKFSIAGQKTSVSYLVTIAALSWPRNTSFSTPTIIFRK